MPTESPRHETDWTAIYERLQSGEYEVAARRLLDMQIASLQIGDSTSAAVAAAARQICLALVTYRAEVEWHELAQSNAELRQRSLREHVLSLLSLLRDDTLSQVLGRPAGPEADLLHDNIVNETSPEHLTPWRRIQHLLERQRPASPLTGEESRKVDQEERQEDLPLPNPPIVEESREGATSDWMPDRESKIGEQATRSASSAAEPTTENEMPRDPSQPEGNPSSDPSSDLSSAEAGEHVTPDLPAEHPSAAVNATGALPEPPETPADASEVFSTSDEPPDLAIYCLGAFRIHQYGKPIAQWNGLKGLLILKYLATHRGTPVSKDMLMDVFWPEADIEAARRNLHQAVYSLRQTLRRSDPDVQHIQFENNQYFLNPDLSIWVDVEEFENHVRRARGLEAAGKIEETLAEFEIADSLYQGAFLEEDMYEEWPRAWREQLRNTYLEIADRASEYYLGKGLYPVAIGLCQKLLGQDSCYENVHRRLMHCYLAQGQRNLAIRQYQTCVQTLSEELDMPPSEETVALYEEIVSSR